MIETIPWIQLLGTTPIEIIATLSAVCGVVLIARQNILGWPLGILWAAISTWLAFTQWQLISDGILYLSYIPIQIYCWMTWARSRNPLKENSFVPVWLPRRKQLLIIIAAVLGIAGWAFGISTLSAHVSWIPEPSLLWRDSTTTVLNFFAQFLQAHKRMENWVLWLVVNLLGIHIYWIKEAPIYSIQYAIFLVIGIYGWIQWHKSIRSKKQPQV